MPAIAFRRRSRRRYGSPQKFVWTFPPKQTSVARLSFAPAGTPRTRTAHSISVRARTTSGSTGKLLVSLYDGATVISNLETTPLTNSLATYSLTIADAEAELITSYQD